MVFDFSEKGKEEFYREFFKYVERIEKRNLPIEDKYLKIQIEIDRLKKYENQRKEYQKQLKILWNIKKKQLIISEREKETLEGVVSLETQEREKKISKYESRLRKMSRSFEEDLMNNIIKTDPIVLLVKENN